LSRNILCFQCVGVLIGLVENSTGEGRSKYVSKYPTRQLSLVSCLASRQKDDEKLTQELVVVRELRSILVSVDDDVTMVSGGRVRIWTSE
jgi:hypothetical protein